ncbi:EAL domain-containing protein [Bacillus sp. PS06]|uniref:sensor domain-containing protein n=1 Tax=Bacillus sp. PS06 TaxID=2764176 RepID=UPI00177D065B|nr:EAL domain-containing protein [Bacillus sp. PS06]MBD8070613.1 EAL domain-containing protein [Bacillus sp. PS06]
MRGAIIEEQLKMALKKLKDIDYALNESSIVAITDSKGMINYVNEKFCQISKYSYDELIGQDHRLVNSSYHSKVFFKNLWKKLGNGEVWKGEIRNRAKDGSFYWVDTTIVPFLNEEGQPYQYISIRNDITARKKYEEKIKQLAFYDQLTNLPNRNLLRKQLKECFLCPSTEPYLAVLFLDLDRFKKINDTFGHNFGDSTLVKVAERLKHCLQNNAFVSRIGGDEFVILLKVKDHHEAEGFASAILKAFSIPFLIGKRSISISPSIGISINPLIKGKSRGEIDRLVEYLIKEADIAMYTVKEKGGNHYRFHTAQLNSVATRSYFLEIELYHALEQKELSLEYQPIVNTLTGTMIGVEALLRWRSPKFGHVSPEEFIPVLEETGLIKSVGKWVLKETSRQMKKWLDEGLEISHVAVNISPIQFNDPLFMSDYLNILDCIQLSPKYIELEVTETTIHNFDHSLQILKELSSYNVNISIDDFGTGYSSLNRLKHLPITSLKIDKSFIQTFDEDDRLIVKTIIDLGRNLHFNVIAEGIETGRQLELLKELGCMMGQGYYFSKPVPANQVPALVNEFAEQGQRRNYQPC